MTSVWNHFGHLFFQKQSTYWSVCLQVWVKYTQ